MISAAAAILQRIYFFFFFTAAVSDRICRRMFEGQKSVRCNAGMPGAGAWRHVEVAVRAGGGSGSEARRAGGGRGDAQGAGGEKISRIQNTLAFSSAFKIAARNCNRTPRLLLHGAFAGRSSVTVLLLLLLHHVLFFFFTIGTSR